MQRFKLSADRKEQLVGADLLLWHHSSSMPKMQNDIHSVVETNYQQHFVTYVAYCFMEEIIHLYDQHLATPFPNRRGDEILGVDLVLVDSDTAGLIDKYIGSRGQLSADDIRILKHCYSDLKTVVKELSGADRQYFARLQNIGGLMLEKIEDEDPATDKKSFKPEWENSFLKIREVLNEWDPIGVAESVKDEYDAINFRTLSALMNNRDKKEIREILVDYTRNSMDITVDDATLDRLSEQISNIRLE